MYPVNTITGLPLFQLMCALDGRESGTLVLSQTWPVFLAFCRIPAASTDDQPGFQAEVTRDDLDTPVLEVRLVRQLTDDVGGFGPVTRALYAEFLFEGVPDNIEGHTLWARDFDSLEAFCDAVEATPEYRWAVEGPSRVDTFGREDQPVADAG